MVVVPFIGLFLDDSFSFFYLGFDFLMVARQKLPRLVVLDTDLDDAYAEALRGRPTIFGSVLVCRKCACANMFECRICI